MRSRGGKAIDPVFSDRRGRRSLQGFIKIYRVYGSQGLGEHVMFTPHHCRDRRPRRSVFVDFRKPYPTPCVRTNQRLPCAKGAPPKAVRDCFYNPSVTLRAPPPLTQGRLGYAFARAPPCSHIRRDFSKRSLIRSAHASMLSFGSFLSHERKVRKTPTLNELTLTPSESTRYDSAPARVGENTSYRSRHRCRQGQTDPPPAGARGRF